MRRLQPRRPRRAARPSRHGSVVTELAVVAPLLVLFTFGSIQVCNTAHLKQALTSAVYEGTRLVPQRDATREVVEQMMTQILVARGVSGVSLQIDPPGPLADLSPGQLVTIQVSAPTEGNVVGPSLITFQQVLTAEGVASR
jgi:Flp pilus assembly protein TadG